MHVGERKVLVDEPHLVLVARQGGGKQRLVHARAVGALEVVEVDDGDLGCGIAADRAAGNVDCGGGILGQVEGLQMGQLLAVGGDQEVDYLRLGVVREGDGQRVITCKRAGLARAEGHVDSPGAG